MESIAKMIEREVLSWTGTSVEPHRFSGVEFRVNHHEMGHLHGSRQADLPFPVRVRRELVAAGRASPHHILPDTGWVTYYIRGYEDVPAVVELFRLNYDRLTAPRKPDVSAGATGGVS
ncbi:MAG: luciferase family protein [Chloroflexia bacterium]